MRNPERLYSFYEKIMKIHMKEFPDWRFGQLMCNFFYYVQDKGNDPFFLEEDRFIKEFKEFTNGMKGRK